MKQDELAEIYTFLRANHRIMTYEDMADELCKKKSLIVYHCEKLGIKAISCREKAKLFILECYKRKPKTWIAEKLGMELSYIHKLYSELKISAPEFTNDEIISPRKVFSRASIGNYERLFSKL